MTYRGELDAARERIVALEHEVRDLREAASFVGGAEHVAMLERELRRVRETAGTPTARERELTAALAEARARVETPAPAPPSTKATWALVVVVGLAAFALAFVGVTRMPQRAPVAAHVAAVAAPAPTECTLADGADWHSARAAP